MNLPSLTVTNLDGGGLPVGMDARNGEDALGKHEVIVATITARMNPRKINFLSMSPVSTPACFMIVVEAFFVTAYWTLYITLG